MFEGAIGDDVRLDSSYVLAFVASNDEIIGESRSDGPSYLVLVREDGTYDTVQGADLIGGDVVWSDEGVFYSDSENDYVLDESGLTTIPSPKRGADQMSATQIEPGVYVSVYNVGFEGNDGYTSEVVVASDEASVYDVEGSYYWNALCDKSLYDVTTDAGLHRHEYEGSASEDELEFMAQLYPPTDGRETLVGWRESRWSVAGGPVLPCADGVVTFIAASRDGDLSTDAAMIVNWDTTTGESTEVAMTFDTGEPFPSVDAMSGSYGANSIRNGAFEWIDTEGVLWATDCRTGVTSKKFVTDSKWVHKLDSTKPIFTDESIVITVTTPEGDAVVKVVDRNTGKVTTTVEFPGWAERLYADRLAMWSVAIKPGWA